MSRSALFLSLLSEVALLGIRKLGPDATDSVLLGANAPALIRAHSHWAELARSRSLIFILFTSSRWTGLACNI